jgi:Raf kinase inhibitor-like YbhB/YbcL family protein
MQLFCDAFGHDRRIPLRYTADGENVSPPLRWSEPPPGARELAVVVEEADETDGQPAVHWLLYGIPPEVRELPEGVERSGELDDTSSIMPGMTSTGHLGWDGPQPSVDGTHQLRFRLYALDAPLGAEPGLATDELLEAIAGHVVGEAELVATCECRPFPSG